MDEAQEPSARNSFNGVTRSNNGILKFLTNFRDINAKAEHPESRNASIGQEGESVEGKQSVDENTTLFFVDTTDERRIAPDSGQCTFNALPRPRRPHFLTGSEGRIQFLAHQGIQIDHSKHTSYCHDVDCALPRKDHRDDEPAFS